MNDAFFNYVAVLVSIVTGLAATQILSALSDIIQVANRKRAYWIHTLWMVNVFINLMLFWWVLYRWHNAREWTFFLFIWVNIPPILIYLATGVLFPAALEGTGSHDWRDYYYKNRRGFFFIFGAIWPLDVIDTLLKGKQHLLELGPLYPTVIALWTLGCVVAGVSRKEGIHALWAILFPVSQVVYAALVLLRLG